VATAKLGAIGPIAADGTVRVEAGCPLGVLARHTLARGWLPAVLPGTRHVSVGGAIAADIHGKNHHRRGSWCEHVSRIRLALPSGDLVEATPDGDHADLFWATAGGMGLTGVIVDATFRCPRIETSRLLVDTHRTADLDELMATLDATDHDYEYSVAWIDLLARGRSLGRSVLTRGHFARADQLDGHGDDLLAFEPVVLASTPPLVPSGLLNRLTVRAFNEVWYRKAPAQREGEVQTISQFFHPLDLLDHWNRMYGPRGFLQWQFVVPFGAEGTLRTIVEKLSASGCTSFLAVLKRFGAGDPGPLSFPVPGWTLALDIPIGPPGLAELLDRLDVEVAEVGGRVYLAKDSRLRPELVPAMYPRLDEWRAVRHRADPDGVLRSDLGRRLHLC
jgi:decaprenylphospho-beta-D-ribofuranose 2-oxidase